MGGRLDGDLFDLLEEVARAYAAHFSHEEALLDMYLWEQAAAAATGGGAAAGGFDRSASMRKSHFADHARMLRELAAPATHVQQQQEREREEEDEEEWGSEESMVPRGVVERALRDFEAHANRYDSYGDELSAALSSSPYES